MDYYRKLRIQIQKGEISPLYLLSGEEEYLIEGILTELERACFVEGEPKDFNFDLFDGETATLTEVIEAAITLPVFASRRLVIVKNAHWFLSKRRKANGEVEEEVESVHDDRVEPLLEYLDNPSPSTTLVFVLRGNVDKRKKIYKEMKKKGFVWESARLKGGDLRGFITNWFRERGKKIDNRTLAHIMETQQGELVALTQELEKLVAYVGERKEINYQDAVEILTVMEQHNVFELTDAVGAKNPGRALWLLRKMFNEGEREYYIVSMLIFQLRLIARTKALSEKYFTQQEVIKRAGTHPYPARKALQQSRNFSQDDIILALEKLSEADVAIKLSSGKTRAILERTIFELCS